LITEAGIRSAIRTAQKDEKQIELKDDGGRGDGRLLMLVRPKNDEALTEWYASYYRAGRRKLVKIGNYPGMSVADARRTFREDYLPVITAGGDPEGPRSRKPKALGTSVYDLFLAYVEHLEKTATEAYAKQARYTLIGKEGDSGLAKSIGPTKAARDVEPRDIIPYLAGIHGRGSVVMAARVRQHASAAFSFAIRSSNAYTRPAGVVDWGLKVNPVLAIPADPEAERVGERHLSPDEFVAFWKWLDTHKDSSTAASAIQVIMATGQRVTEILRVAIDHYDKREKIVDWSKTKNGMPHAIPLPQIAADELNRMWAGPTGLLFPSKKNPRKCLTMNAAEKAIALYLKNHPDVPHFTPRDLRRTWKTLAGAAGLSKEIRDRIQNHARRDISSRHYDRYEYMAEKREAMERWAAYVERLLNGGNVVPIRPAA